MLLKMMHELSTGAQDTVFVGDSVTDLRAAQAAGCTGVLVRTGNGRKSEAAAIAQGMVVRTFDDLAGFVDDCLS
jgi:D-glycero-D-manno-heptose 1,7-bisphosphate phosphatase